MVVCIFGRHRRAVAAISCAVVLLVTGLPAGAGEGFETTHPLTRRAAASQYIGASGCAATNCHGGSRAAELKLKLNGSYNACLVWHQKDPHARAYEVLHNPLSHQIARGLDGGRDDYTRPWKRSDCLVCHAVNAKAGDGDDIDRTGKADPLRLARGHRFDMSDGVSCEGCHGPAHSWVGLHHRPGWKAGLSADELWTRYGFRNTKHLPTRARVCAGCHIGASGGDEVTGDRNMNHDMIAAGHPRLDYEFSAFQQMMPAHWNRPADETRDRNTPPDPNFDESKSGFEADAWLIGQLVTAEAALDLLEARSRTKTFPELAEYDCFACHHDLTQPTWRQPSEGLMKWGTWSTPMVERYGHLFDAAGGHAQVVTGLGTIRGLMEKTPDNLTTIQSTAANVRGVLRTWANSTEPVTAEKARELYREVVASGGATSGLHWDAAAQNYLAAIALRIAVRDMTQGRDQARRGADSQSTTLEAIRRRLLYSENFNSPRDYSPTALEAITSGYTELSTEEESR